MAGIPLEGCTVEPNGAGFVISTTDAKAPLVWDLHEYTVLAMLDGQRHHVRLTGYSRMVRPGAFEHSLTLELAEAERVDGQLDHATRGLLKLMQWGGLLGLAAGVIAFGAQGVAVSSLGLMVGGATAAAGGRIGQRLLYAS